MSPWQGQVSSVHDLISGGVTSLFETCSYPIRLFTGRLTASVAILLLACMAEMANAGAFQVFGPETYQRIRGEASSVYETSFSVRNADTAYTLNIYNGGVPGSGATGPQVTAAEIRLNGRIIAGSKVFKKKKAPFLSIPVNVLSSNQLVLTLKGKPGSVITVEVISIDNEPPTITATVNPTPNVAGWNNTDVTVSFDCSDAISGIESCTDPVTVTADGANQAVTGSGIDRAGNSATASATVNLDKTAPQVTISSPSDGSEADTGTVVVSGTANDNLALAGVVVNGVTAPLNGNSFTVTVPLTEGSNTITATAVDEAGNESDHSISVNYVTEPIDVTLGVYSETNIDPLLYSNITNSADLGGKDTVTTEVATGVVVPLEGDKSLQVTFDADDPVSGSNNNGFAFDFARATSNGANDLINSSFEIPDASAGDVDCTTIADGGTSSTGIPGWECFNGAFVASNNFRPGGPTDVRNPTAVDGSQLMKLFNRDGLAQQSIAVAAGENVNASVYAMSWIGDVFNNLFILELNFYDAGNARVGIKKVFANSVGTADYLLEPKDGDSATDWTLMEVSEVAPAGTVRAQILMIQILTDGTPDTGSVALDGARLYAEPPLVDSVDILSYERLKFGINTTASTGLMDLEVKMEDENLVSASVFLSAYTPSETTGDWAVYEIPLADFGSALDRGLITSLGFYNASTVVNTDAASPALFDTTLYFDDVYFEKSSTSPDVLTGVLIDTPVQGVTFVTATQSGITNVDGRFAYVDGETITFSVGGIVLGTVTAAPVISPVELSGVASSIDQTAINLMVFLQSIDEDQFFFFGIAISPATQAAAATQTLDFTLDSVAFTAAVTPVVTAITSDNPTGPNPVLSETAALDNFYLTYINDGGSDTFTWVFPPQYPTYPGAACLPVDFEAGGCPYYIFDFFGAASTVIDNPDTTGNSSAKVAQVQKFANSPETFGGSLYALGTVDFSVGEVFTMKVKASRPVPVTFKLESGAFGSSFEESRVVNHSGSGAWEELTFDFTGFLAGSDVTIVTVFFDVSNAGDAAGNPADWTFYMDDIALTDSSSIPNIPKTYELIWSDEFNVDGVPDTDNWTIDLGTGPDFNGWGNNEWQVYTDLPENIRVEGGDLVITANCSLATTAPENCGVRDGTVTSGKVISQDKFSFKYGKVEARIKPPVGQGSWPAFWMLGANHSDVGWPMSGEVDIVEMNQYLSNPQTTSFTMHWCGDTGPCTILDGGRIFVTDRLMLAESLGDDYHVFSAEWDANGITGKIDDTPYFFLAIDPVTMDEFLKEFFVLLNVAMGGTLGSDEAPPNGSETWPQVMLVDYVRVYQDVNNSESTFTIGSGAPLQPLGVYSETNINPL